MLAHIAPYLLLFLPLISSLCCFLINFKKSSSWIFAITLISMVFVVAILSLDIMFSGVVNNNRYLGIVSVATEYHFDFMSIFFLAMVLLARLVIEFFDYQNLEKAFISNSQSFYGVSLLGIFSVVGIFSANNIFNLFIFIEIYCLTFCVITAMSDDLSLSKLARKYFYNSVLSSIFLILALVLLYLMSGQFEIDKISIVIANQNYDPIFVLIIVTICLKLFPIQNYFEQLKRPDRLSGLANGNAFIINSLIGFYLFLKILLFIFFPSKIFFILAVMLGFVLVFYGNYKTLKAKYLRLIASYFALINLGFVLIAIGFFGKQALDVALMYIAANALSSLIIFGLASLVRDNFLNCHLNNLRSFVGDGGSRKKLIMAGVVMVVFYSPIAISFWANWNLSILSFGFDSVALSLIPIITTILMMIGLLITWL